MIVMGQPWTDGSNKIGIDKILHNGNWYHTELVEGLGQNWFFEKDTKAPLSISAWHIAYRLAAGGPPPPDLVVLAEANFG